MRAIFIVNVIFHFQRRMDFVSEKFKRRVDRVSNFPKKPGSAPPASLSFQAPDQFGDGSQERMWNRMNRLLTRSIEGLQQK
jgi:hypothetical protein